MQEIIRDKIISQIASYFRIDEKDFRYKLFKGEYQDMPHNNCGEHCLFDIDEVYNYFINKYGEC